MAELFSISFEKNCSEITDAFSCQTRNIFGHICYVALDNRHRKRHRTERSGSETNRIESSVYGIFWNKQFQRKRTEQFSVQFCDLINDTEISKNARQCLTNSSFSC